MTDISSPVVVQSMGIIMPSISSCKDMGNYCNTGTLTHSPEVKNIPGISGMSKRETRRMARLTNLALTAAAEAFGNVGKTPENGALFIGLTHGSTSLLCEFHDYLFDFGPEMASPNAFSNGVTSAPLGVLSKHLNLTQGGVTFVGYENCGMETLNSAAISLRNTAYSFCLAGAAEEYSSIIEDVYSRCGWFDTTKKGNAIPGGLKNLLIEKRRHLTEGSVFFSLSSEIPSDNAGNKRICYFKPLENPRNIDIAIDLIISGMYGTLQDEVEFDVISDISNRQNKKPSLLFSKLLFGESFAVGALASSALAWDILVNSTSHAHRAPYIFFRLEDKEKMITLKMEDLENIKTILIISADRSNRISAGIFSKDLIE